MPGADLDQRLEAAARVRHPKQYELLIQKRYQTSLREQANTRTVASSVAPPNTAAPHNGPASTDPVIIAELRKYDRENGKV
jgi:hypothetical protein